MLNYSIVIRTVGTAGEKYQTMLDCINRQTIQPFEVIVVLPKGYTLPEERLGYEKFVFSEKGMVSQRIYGGKMANSEYILFLDDDLAFEDEFVEKISAPVLNGISEVSIPVFLEMLPPKHGIRKIIPMLSLSAVPTLFHRNDMYTKILRSGGWSYNNFGARKVAKYLKTETAAGACYFINKDVFLSIDLEDELWLQDTGYALWDDQVQFYKLHLQGNRIVCVTDVYFAHLDAGKNNPDRNQVAAYANSRNKAIFWYKFIYKEQTNLMGRIIARIMFEYSMMASCVLGCVNRLRSNDKRKEAQRFRDGLRDGKKYINQNLRNNR
ncbi:MAG: hypothetical protein LIO93_09690 [Bacteroidales bacterium]|nr:hypothetical protein [Bacteroidales bacterium]